MSNSKTDLESFLAIDPDFEESGRPLHESVRLLFGKIEVLWAHKRLLILSPAVGFGLAMAYSMLMPNKYEATAFVIPPSMNRASGMDILIGMKSSGAVSNFMSGALGSMFGANSPGPLYIQEMQSRPVEDSLIKRFDLNRVYKTKSKEAARKALEANTKFNEDKKSGILSVKVTDRDPVRAAAIANGFAEELGRLLSDLDSTAGRREREYFESQLEIARGQLANSSKALSEFSSRNAALNLPLQSAAIVSGMSTVQGQLIAAEAELKGLLPIYSENNIRVRQTRAQIAELQRQLDQIKGKTLSSDPRSPGMPSSDGSPSGIQQLEGISAEYMNLYRKARTDEAMVETLTQQYEIAKLEESRHVAEVQLLDPAQPPEKKAYPKRRLISMTGLFLGLLLAVVYVLTSDWWHNTSEDNEWKKLLRPIRNKFVWRSNPARAPSER